MSLSLGGDVRAALSDDAILPLRIGGESVSTGAAHPVTSPWSGAELAKVAWAGPEDVDRAIAAAVIAPHEHPLSVATRAEVLDRVAGLLRRRRDEIASLICAEVAKPLRLAALEVDRAQATFTLAATAARTTVGEMIPADATESGAGKLAFTIRVPAGVVAAITPFNFPLNLVAHKIAPAIAAGCPVVLKPTDKAPLTAFLLAELLEDAGLPPGWLNVVLGAPVETVQRIVDDPRIAIVTFTGSAEVGWSIRARAPRTKVLLELGNSTPAIVMADADLDEAARRLCASAYAFAGQACISVQRIYVQRDAIADFEDRFIPAVQRLIVGDPADPATDVGPVIDLAARDRILASVGDAVEQGATVLAGGVERGPAVMPTVLSDVTPDMPICQREIFGPVVTLAAFDTLDEAIAAANSTDYGLQAGIFTANLDAALRAARELHFGGVTINETPSFRADGAPYGGIKSSGNTKEGPMRTVHEMTDERLVLIEQPI